MNNKLIAAFSLVIFFGACKETPVPVTNTASLEEQFAAKRIHLSSQYDELDSFSVADGLARAKKGELYGYIDTSGKEVLPITHYFAQPFSDGLGMVEEPKGTLFCVDKTGKKVLDLGAFESGFSFRNGFATVADKTGYGLIDKTGKLVIPCISGQAIFELQPGHYILTKEGYKTIVDAQGKNSLPLKGFNSIYYDEVNNQYALDTDTGWVISGADGKIKFKTGAEGLINNGGGVYFLSKNIPGSGTQNAVMNGKGELVVPYGKYYSINSFVGNGLICVGQKTGEAPTEEAGISNVLQKIGYIDVNGKEVIPLEFEDLMNDFSEGMCVVKKAGKIGYIDNTGKLIIPCKFTRAEPFIHGYAKVWDGDIYSYIDKKGIEVK